MSTGVSVCRELIAVAQNLNRLNCDFESFESNISEEESELDAKEMALLEDMIKIFKNYLPEEASLADTKETAPLEDKIILATDCMAKCQNKLIGIITSPAKGKEFHREIIPYQWKWINEDADILMEKIFNVHVDRKLIYLNEKINNKEKESNLLERLQQIKNFETHVKFSFSWGQLQLLALEESEVVDLSKT